MKTLSQIILDLTSDPNLIGEILRDKFFKQDKENGKFGCYSTFELRENVVELLGKRNFDYGFENIGVTVTCAQLEDVVMTYFSDGDLNLEFYFPNGKILSNDDAKKDSVWKWVK